MAEALRSEVARSQPGRQLDSISTLAKRFGVSQITVRNALLLLSHQGLVELRHGSGCYVSERSGSTHVGVYTDWDLSSSHTSYFFLHTMQELRRFFAQRGQRVRLYMGNVRPGGTPTGLSCHEFLEDVAADKLSGVALLSTLFQPQWGNPLSQRKVPVVGCWYEHEYNIALDYPGMIERGTRYLVSQGRKKIALLGWFGRTPPHDQYYRAFADVLAEHRLPVNDNWIRTDLHPWLEAAGWEEFRELWLAQPDKPDALLIADDNLYRGAAVAMLELGIRVPEDLLLVTHTNKGSGMFRPVPAACLEFDPAELAMRMGETLWRRMQNEPDVPKQVTVPFQFVENPVEPVVNVEKS